jgi:hypothetical protein
MRSAIMMEEQFIRNQQYTNLQICSDGESRNKKRKFWYSGTMQSKNCMTVSSCIPEIYIEPNSNRSECYGILISVQIKLLIQQYLLSLNIPIQPHYVYLCCNNKSAVDTIINLKGYDIALHQHWSPNMDIIRGTISELKEAKQNNGSIKNTTHFWPSRQKQKQRIRLDKTRRPGRLLSNSWIKTK